MLMSYNEENIYDFEQEHDHEHEHTLQKTF